jgi:hypothetical protein
MKDSDIAAYQYWNRRRRDFHLLSALFVIAHFGSDRQRAEAKELAARIGQLLSGDF